jgi:hypothetical protein
VTLPRPQPGLVIHYSYLWADQQAAGAEEGRKNRPCAVILSNQTIEGEQIVTVVPLTHTTPRSQEDAVELPNAVKTHLGLDEERSWIVITEFNSFLWPGPDLRRRPGVEPPRFDYGMLPPRLFAHLRDKLLAAHAARRVAAVKRSE